MARPKPWEIDDELWSLIEPLLPKVQRRSDHPGRRRLDDRKVLQGIPLVLHTGIPWEWLQQQLGSGSGMTRLRRLRDRNEAGVWHRYAAVRDAVAAFVHRVRDRTCHEDDSKIHVGRLPRIMAGCRAPARLARGVVQAIRSQMSVVEPWAMVTVL
jgi:transposase